jgi:hypothetical protein
MSLRIKAPILGTARLLGVLFAKAQDHPSARVLA